VSRLLPSRSMIPTSFHATGGRRVALDTTIRPQVRPHLALWLCFTLTFCLLLLLLLLLPAGVVFGSPQLVVWRESSRVLLVQTCANRPAPCTVRARLRPSPTGRRGPRAVSHKLLQGLVEVKGGKWLVLRGILP